jgi:hypothetical protein
LSRRRTAEGLPAKKQRKTRKRIENGDNAVTLDRQEMIDILESIARSSESAIARIQAKAQAEGGNLKVAVQSFVAEYDGRRVAIHRGTDFVADDHELMQRYPYRFAPAPRERHNRVDRMSQLVAARLLRSSPRT